MAFADQGGAVAAEEGLSAGRLLLMVFPPIMLPIFMAVMDQTIVSAALPAIAGSLGGVERVSWVVLSYLVANTVAAPVYGRLGDVFGRKRLMLGALALFVVASLLCAAAGSIVTLTAARVLQGLGGGGLMVLAQALIGENVPARERGRYQGYLSAVIVCASTFGPVAGGALTQSFGWPAVFLVNLPLGLLAMGLALRLPSQPSNHGAIAPGALKFDWLGLLFFAACIVPLLLTLEGAQHLREGPGARMLVTFAVAAVALMLLVRHEQRVPQPLFPGVLLGQPSMWRAAAMAACSGGLLVSEVTFLPIYLHVVNGASAGQIGLLMLPLTATVGIGSLITGTLVTRTGRTAIFPSIGQPVALVALAAVAFVVPHLPQWGMSVWALPGALAVVAIFQGTAMPVAQITAQNVAGPGMLGAAAACVQLSRSVGSAIAVAIVSAVLFGALALAAPQTLGLFAEMVEHGPAVLDGLDEGARLAVRADIAGAFRAAFLVIALFAGCSGMLAWTMPRRRI